ncbi:MAG: hypothetical protein AAF420_10055 [Pseudomonadota bacterium]
MFRISCLSAFPNTSLATLAKSAVRLISVLLVFAIPTLTVADVSLRIAASYPDYALLLQHTRTDMSFENAASDARFRESQLGVAFGNSASDWLKLRLIIGNIGFSIDDSPRGDNFDPAGTYLGVSLDLDFPLSERVAFVGSSEYRYIKAEDTIDTSSIEYRMDELITSAGLRIQLSESITLQGGVRNLWVDGRERFQDSGTVETSDFEAADSASAYLLLKIYQDRSGYVGLQAESGARESLSVYFRRSYRFR